MKAIGQAIDRDALAGEAQRSDRERGTRQRRSAQAFGAEEHQPEALQREMAADRGDQQHQHRGVRDRLKRDAIEEQSDRRDDQQRQRDVDRNRGLGAGQPVGQGQDRHRQDDVERGRARDQPWAQRPPCGKQVEAEGDDAHRHRQPRRARHLAGRQHGVAQRAIGDEFALRDQDHARDGKHQHQRKPEQRIDRAIGDAVLQQEQHDRRIQDLALPLASGRSRPLGVCRQVRYRQLKGRRYLIYSITIIKYNLKARPAGGPYYRDCEPRAMTVSKAAARCRQAFPPQRQGSGRRGG